MNYRPAVITPEIEGVGIDDFDDEDFVAELIYRMKDPGFQEVLAKHGMTEAIHNLKAAAFCYQSILCEPIEIKVGDSGYKGEGPALVLVLDGVID